MAKGKANTIEGAELITEAIRLELKPGETLVFRTESPIRPEWRVYLEKQLKALFPNNTTLVVDGSFDLFVLATAEPEVVGDAEGGTGDPD